MDSQTALSDRVRERVITRASPVSRVLGHPIAFVITALVLLWIFAGPFITDSARVAPTKDPAYYSWRIETLTSEKPAALLDIRGAFGMFSGGYRVANAVLGAYLREIAGMSLIKTTVVLMVGIPWVIALSLAGFAYRQRRDPLLWHAVAYASAGLLLTAPYVGYMDNVLCLAFLAAAIWFIGPAARSWPARIALLLLLVAAGITHPTTLVFFVLTLFFIAAARLLLRGFALRSVLADDGPMLVTAVVAVVLMYVIWKIGLWGPSESLSDAALPPPYSSDFFISRMALWVEGMRPYLNGIFFAIAAVVLLSAGRRAAEDDLARVSLGWLLPLVGLFGFLAGFTYPYYRFFNTTLAIPLLVGIGAYFALKFFLDWVDGGGIGWLGLIGVAAVLFVLVTNVTNGLTLSGWTKPDNQWISTDQRQQLSLLRTKLESEPPNRPIVFVVDDSTSTFQIWGITKLAGNTSRYGLPRGRINDGYEYLGSVKNFLASQPTQRPGQETYNKVSRAQMSGVQHVLSNSSEQPLVVLVQSFNLTGSNADIASGKQPPPGRGEVWVLNDQGLTTYQDGSRTQSTPLTAAPSEGGGSLLHLLRVIGAFLLLLLPGWLAFRWAVPEGGLALGLGMVPTLSATLLALVGTVALAIIRNPFTGGLIWGAVIATCVIAAALRLGAGVAPRRDVAPSLS